MIENVLISVIVISVSYVFHELGHYLMALRLGVKNPRFFLNKDGFMTGFGVTYHSEITEATYEKLILKLREMILFRMAGIFGVLPILIYGSLSHQYLVSTTLAFMFCLYSLWETGSSLDNLQYKITEDKRDCH